MAIHTCFDLIIEQTYQLQSCCDLHSKEHNYLICRSLRASWSLSQPQLIALWSISPQSFMNTRFVTEIKSQQKKVSMAFRPRPVCESLYNHFNWISLRKRWRHRSDADEGSDRETMGNINHSRSFKETKEKPNLHKGNNLFSTAINSPFLVVVGKGTRRKIDSSRYLELFPAKLN